MPTPTTESVPQKEIAYRKGLIPYILSTASEYW